MFYFKLFASNAIKFGASNSLSQPCHNAIKVLTILFNYLMTNVRFQRIFDRASVF